MVTSFDITEEHMYYRLITCGSCWKSTPEDDGELYYCNEHGFCQTCDWFCADGERKEEE